MMVVTKLPKSQISPLSSNFTLLFQGRNREFLSIIFTVFSCNPPRFTVGVTFSSRILVSPSSAGSRKYNGQEATFFMWGASVASFPRNILTDWLHVKTTPRPCCLHPVRVSDMWLTAILLVIYNNVTQSTATPHPRQLVKTQTFIKKIWHVTKWEQIEMQIVFTEKE